MKTARFLGVNFIKKLNDDLESKILKAIDDHKMLSIGDNIVVAVSGGSDSMLLLHFLLKFSTSLNLNLIVAHVNHCLRGEESDRDENFVRNFCEKNNIKFELLKIDINKLSKEKKLSLEECGRDIRYQFFNSLNLKNYKIATAHNLSDYAETVILNLTRGSGTAGLLGIPPKRNNIIRPLIYLKKDEIKNYCKDKNILYVEDSTNFLDDYTRNKIRLKVIPILKEINPNFESSILNMGSILKRDNDYLNSLADDTLSRARFDDNKYDLNILNELDDALKTRCVRRIVSKIDGNFNISYLKMKLILKAMREKSGALNLFKNVFLKAKGNFLGIFCLEEKPLDWETELIKDDIILTANGRKFIIRIVEKLCYDDLLKKDPKKLHCALDYDCIPENCLIRNRRPHDRFTLKNRNVTKSLKKFFNEQKVEVFKRYKLAMIAHENEVLWLESFGSSNKTKVTDSTKKVLIIISDDNNN